MEKYNFNNFFSVSEDGNVSKVNEKIKGWGKVNFPAEWPYGACLEALDFAVQSAAFSGAHDYRGRVESMFGLSAGQLMDAIVASYNE